MHQSKNLPYMVWHHEVFILSNFNFIFLTVGGPSTCCVARWGSCERNLSILSTQNVKVGDYGDYATF